MATRTSVTVRSGDITAAAAAQPVDDASPGAAGLAGQGGAVGPGAGDAGEPGGRGPTAWRRLLQFNEAAPMAALIALVLIIGLTHGRFFDAQVIQSNIRTAAYVAIIAFGMVFLLAMGEIDLSVGGTYGVAFFIAAKMGDAGASPYLAALVAIAVSVLLGAANGALAALFRAPVIIVTLGTFSLYRGIVDVLSGGSTVGANLNLSGSFFTTLGGQWIGIPAAGWIALAAMVLFTVVLTRSRTGAMVRAVGANRLAAEFSGIPAGRLRMYCLMLTGGLAGVSAVLSLAYVGSADSTIGTGFELQVIAAAIIGGTAVTGGMGSVPGALIGALIVVVINSGLVFFSINSLWSNVVTGVVILIAVGGASLLAHRRAAWSTAGS